MLLPASQRINASTRQRIRELKYDGVHQSGGKTRVEMNAALHALDDEFTG